MEVLADGKIHSVDQLLAAIDEYADKNNLRWHIHHLKKKLNKEGLTVVNLQEDGNSYHRLARFLDSRLEYQSDS